MSFAAEFPIRFGDIDHARVVYYPRFFHYFHQAFEDWFGGALGIPYADVITKENIGFPSVKIECEFLKPLRYGDRVRIGVELVSIGEKSITNRYVMTRLPDGDVAARATITTVAIDNDTFRAIPITDAWRKRFESFMSKTK